MIESLLKLLLKKEPSIFFHFFRKFPMIPCSPHQHNLPVQTYNRTSHWILLFYLSHSYLVQPSTTPNPVMETASMPKAFHPAGQSPIELNHAIFKVWWIRLQSSYNTHINLFILASSNWHSHLHTFNLEALLFVFFVKHKYGNHWLLILNIEYYYIQKRDRSCYGS